MTWLFKIKTAVKILCYLFLQMIWFSLIRLFRSVPYQQSWLVRNTVAWANLVAREIHLRFRTKNRKILQSVDWGRNVFLVANHQSYADIPAIYASSEMTFGFLAKQELRSIPFLHFWMKLQGCVFIQRKKYVSAIKTLRKLSGKGKAFKLAIFPEGTRSKNGKLSPFKSGALNIAWHLDAVLVPTCIRGTRRAWENREQPLKEITADICFQAPLDLREIKKDLSFKQFFNQFETYFLRLHGDSAADPYHDFFEDSETAGRISGVS